MSTENKVRETLKIENIVASTNIEENIDLVQVNGLFDGSEYDPEHFPGVIVRLDKPKTTVLVFRSGKLVSTGAKSFEDVDAGINMVADRLNQANLISEVFPYIKFQNIVFSANLGREVNLNKAALGLGLENVEYEPDRFPGLVYRLFVPKVVILIFSTGKIVITGCKEYRDAEETVEILVRDLEGQGILG